jgi:hypothetical protein
MNILPYTNRLFLGNKNILVILKISHIIPIAMDEIPALFKANLQLIQKNPLNS